jgi:hypothetical protein
VTIELVDHRSDECLEFGVARERALEAFRRPYAHAPAEALDLAETRAAVQR